MKIRAENNPKPLSSNLHELLVEYRKRRAFNPNKYLVAKLQAIKDYFGSCGLTAATVGVSGGVDSAVVASILNVLEKENAIQKVSYLFIPSYTNPGVSGQEEALRKSTILSKQLGLNLKVLNIDPVIREVELLFKEDHPSPWAIGQGTAIQRAMLLYQETSILNDKGYKSVVVGTTNRDEGAYLGYVGKASDGLVDLQPISDLHKSEVYQLAELLKIPKEIVQAIPTGDLYDFSSDEEVFGATYDAVELLIGSVMAFKPEEWTERLDRLSVKEKIEWAKNKESLDQFNNYNKHKYRVGTPSIHLDIIESEMFGGRGKISHKTYKKIPLSRTKKPCERVMTFGNRALWINPYSKLKINKNNQRIVIDNVLTEGGLKVILENLNRGRWQKANEHGDWLGGGVSFVGQMKPKNNVGSWRTSFEDKEMSEVLWESIKHSLPPFLMKTPLSRFDAAPNSVWKLTGINPLFRAMRYEEGGFLVPHYDSSFNFSENEKTLYTLVLYLEKSEGGLFRFITDPFLKTPTEEADFSDWSSAPKEKQIKEAIECNPGRIILFNHLNLHDSTVVSLGSKILLRTDVVAERVGVYE